VCGIVGAISERNVVPILLEGLRRLEYRGYDSAGIAIIDEENQIHRERAKGKVAELEKILDEQPLSGNIGVAHTRWATHGVPSEKNAHPHVCNKKVAVVHNGIIENHEQLRGQQRQQGFVFTSETDTEVVVHQIHFHMEKGHISLINAVQETIKDLDGAYALAVISVDEPGKMVVARSGSPLVIGVGVNEYFVASDSSALLPVTQRFIFLDEGDVAEISTTALNIYDKTGARVSRDIKESQQLASAVERGLYKHYMLKEIYEQPMAISETLEGRISGGRVLEASLGPDAKEVLDKVEQVHIIACGTSYHAGLIARYWFEALAGIQCTVEVASEFRYRSPVVRDNTLILTISQSGETADTLAALREAKRRGYNASIAICNVPESSLVRESDLVLMTRAGPEIGVASTKAFTTQLVALMLLVILLGRRGKITEALERELVSDLLGVPANIERVLELDSEIELLSQQFGDKEHALFLGRGTHYPVAMEGALKLKEVSYIHAEAYPAGELKHGPLALVDADMPIIAVAPNNDLLEKLKSNLHEVRARGGKLLVFADVSVTVDSDGQDQILSIPAVSDYVAPIIYTIPLQLLAYHVALCKGTDVDQPRNLAKSVTVE
jgi:glucosamine--fructose-6-phosphate aminotransferase (isomerizing)